MANKMSAKRRKPAELMVKPQRYQCALRERNAAIGEIARLKLDLEVMRSDRKTAEEKYAELQKTCDQRKEQIDKLRQELRTAENQLDEAQREISSQEDHITNLEDEAKTTHEDNELTKARLKAKIDALKEALEALGRGLHS